jgi:hypothetical protein
VGFVLSLFLIPDRYSFPPASGVAFRPYQVMLVALAAMLWFRLLAGHRLRVGMPATALLLLPLAAGVSLLANMARFDAHFLHASVRSFGEMGALALTGIVIAVVAAAPRRRRLILATVLTALTIAALAGAWEESSGRRSFVGLDDVVPVLGVETFSPLADDARPDDASERLGFMTRNGHIRVVGPAKHAIELSALMAVGLPFALAALIRARRWSRRLAMTVVSALLLVVLVLTHSRTGTVGVMIAFAVALALNRHDRRVMAGMFAGALALFATLVLIVPGQLIAMASELGGESTSTSASDHARLSDYRELDRMVGQAPWIGRGIGTWASYENSTGEPLLLDNEYLLTADEVGLVGVVAFLFVVVAAMVGALRWVARAGSERPLAVACACGIATFAVMAAFFDALYFGQIASLFMILIGVVTGALVSHPEP